MDLPNVNPGDLIKASDINKISSALVSLETLLVNHTSQHGSGGGSGITVTDNDTYLTITSGDPGQNGTSTVTDNGTYLTISIGSPA